MFVDKKTKLERLDICKSCSFQDNFLIEHEKPSYKEPPKEVCFYAYKRINHFNTLKFLIKSNLLTF